MPMVRIACVVLMCVIICARVLTVVLGMLTGTLLWMNVIEWRHHMLICLLCCMLLFSMGTTGFSLLIHFIRSLNGIYIRRRNYMAH